MSTLSERLRTRAAEYRAKAAGLELAADELENDQQLRAKASLNGKLRQAIHTRQPAAPTAAGDSKNDVINTVLRTALLEGPQSMSALTARVEQAGHRMHKSGYRLRLMKLGAKVKGRSRGAIWRLPQRLQTENGQRP